MTYYNIGIIGIVLTTLLVLCITHISNICTDSTCDIVTAESSLQRVYILLYILGAVHVGTIIFGMYKKPTPGFTAEILELLRTPSNKRLRRS